MNFALKTDYKTSPPKVFKRGKKGIYSWRQRVCGRDVWRSLHTKNKKEAETLAYRIWFTNQNKDLQEIIELPSFEMEHVWDLHIESEKYQLLAESSKRTREHHWQAFCKWCKKRGIQYINEIDHKIAETFLASHTGANKTFNNILNDLKQICRQMATELKFKNPFEKIEQRSITRGKKASQDYRAFTQDEIDTIFKILKNSKLDNAIEWEKACTIALNTGLRFKDIAFLQWSHIINNEYIELTPHKTSANKKSVIIRLSENLRDMFESMTRRDFYILPKLAKNYSYKSTKQFMRLLNRQNFPGKVGFHSFRSTFITWARQAGVDVEGLGGIVGHTSKEMTEHYNKSAINIDLSFLDQKKIVAKESKSKTKQA